MQDRRKFLTLLTLAGIGLGPISALAETGPAQIGLAIADFSYLDTAGEPTDQTATHARQLTDFMTALRRDLAADGRFRLVLAASADETPDAMVEAAKAAGAAFLVVGGIHKQSTLVQWAKVDAINLSTDRSVFSKLLTFRGDSDEAWVRAETFIARDLRAALGAAGAGTLP
jgi:hypothetical protein